MHFRLQLIVVREYIPDTLGPSSAFDRERHRTTAGPAFFLREIVLRMIYLTLNINNFSGVLCLYNEDDNITHNLNVMCVVLLAK